MRLRTILTVAGVATGGAALCLSASAAAHITVSPETAPADGFVMLDFDVPHGCEGSPTTGVSVKVPDTVPLVTPRRHPLWDLRTKEGPKQRTELFGETVTKGVSEVSWTAKTPLADGQLDVLGMEVKLPKAPGRTLQFPTVQKCERGVTRWIQIPAEGETADDLEEPAPAVQLTAAEGEGNGSTAATEGGASGADTTSASDGDDDDGAPTWLAILALAIGALGLGVGGYGVLVARRAGTA